MNQEERLLSAICRHKDSETLLSPDIDRLFVSNDDVLHWLRVHYGKHNSFPTHNTMQTAFEHLRFDGAPDEVAVELEKLEELYLRSEVHRLFTAQNELLRQGTPPAAVLQQTMRQFSELGQQAFKTLDLDLTQYDSAVQEYKQRQLLRSEHGAQGVLSGLKSIDAAYPTGFAAGQFIVLLAWSGYGKSWASNLLAYNAWLQGYKPMIVSMEMNTSTVRDRVYTVAGEGVLQNTALVDGSVDPAVFEQWAATKFKGDVPGFVVVSTEGMDSPRPMTIDAKIQEHQPDIVFVDYHGLLDDNRQSASSTERHKNVGRELKRLATKTQIPIVDLNQATASDLAVPTAPPLIEQVAWSRDIKNDADLAIGVHLHKESNRMEVVSRKNRHGPEFSFFLDWDINTGKIEERFDELPPTTDELEW